MTDHLDRSDPRGTKAKRQKAIAHHKELYPDHELFMFMDYVFDVTKARELAKQHRLAVAPMPREFAVRSLALVHHDPERDPATLSDEPVLSVLIKLTDHDRQILMIDGYHRLSHWVKDQPDAETFPMYLLGTELGRQCCVWPRYVSLQGA